MSLFTQLKCQSWSIIFTCLLPTVLICFAPFSFHHPQLARPQPWMNPTSVFVRPPPGLLSAGDEKSHNGADGCGYKCMAAPATVPTIDQKSRYAVLPAIPLAWPKTCGLFRYIIIAFSLLPIIPNKCIFVLLYRENERSFHQVKRFMCIHANGRLRNIALAPCNMEKWCLFASLGTWAGLSTWFNTSQGHVEEVMCETHRPRLRRPFHAYSMSTWCKEV